MKFPEETLNIIIEERYQMVPLYYEINTGVIISEKNIKHILEAKKLELLRKIDDISKTLSEYAPNYSNYLEKYKKTLNEKIGEELTHNEYIITSYTTIKDDIKKIESLNNFKKWCGLFAN